MIPPKRLAARLGLFAGLYLAFVVMWPIASRPTAALFRGVGNLAMGRVEFRPMNADASPAGHDTELVWLDSNGTELGRGSANSRHHVYLPFTVLIALIFSGVASFRRGAIALAFATPLLFVFFAGRLALIALDGFARHGDLFASSPRLEAVLWRLAALADLPAVWFLAPVVIGFGVLVARGDLGELLDRPVVEEKRE